MSGGRVAAIENTQTSGKGESKKISRTDDEMESVSIERYVQGQRPSSKGIRKVALPSSGDSQDSLHRRIIDLELALRNEMLLKDTVKAENDTLRLDLLNCR